jgi:hypothetical protein
MFVETFEVHPKVEEARLQECRRSLIKMSVLARDRVPRARRITWSRANRRRGGIGGRRPSFNGGAI